MSGGVSETSLHQLELHCLMQFSRWVSCFDVFCESPQRECLRNSVRAALRSSTAIISRMATGSTRIETNSLIFPQNFDYNWQGSYDF